MNNVIFNVGQSKKTLGLVVELFRACGFEVGEVQRTALSRMKEGVDVSIYVNQSQRRVTDTPTSWFNDQEDSSRDGNPTTVVLVPALPPIRIGDHEVQIRHENVKVGCTTVPWATIEEILRRRNQ